MFFCIISGALIQGAWGLQAGFSGGDSGESRSVDISMDLPKETGLSSVTTISGACRPATRIVGPTPLFEETHGVTDGSGKAARVYVKVENAPWGLTYNSLVIPKEGTAAARGWVSAEQWLTVSKADSIEVKASASFKDRSADAGLEEYKGSGPGEYVTLTGYSSRAYASGNEVFAGQSAMEGTGDFVKM